MVSPQTPFRVPSQSNSLHTSSSTHAPAGGSGPPPPSATTSTHPPSLSSTAPHSAQSQSQSHSNTHAVPSAAPDSPRSSQSPTPEGFQGNLELELLGLANALYNLGTTVINDSTKERDRAVSGLGERERGGGLGLGGGIGGKQVGLRVNQVVQHLNIIDSLAHSELDAHPEYSVYSEFDPPPRSGSGSGSGSGPENRIMIPFQILSDIDNARNPMGLTRERLERAATENQFMNGKIEGVRVSSFVWFSFVDVRDSTFDFRLSSGDEAQVEERTSLVFPLFEFESKPKRGRVSFSLSLNSNPNSLYKYTLFSSCRFPSFLPRSSIFLPSFLPSSLPSSLPFSSSSFLLLFLLFLPPFLLPFLFTNQLIHSLSLSLTQLTSHTANTSTKRSVSTFPIWRSISGRRGRRLWS
ncbi:hypothetical protein FB446DRAFT_769229 [Lentinula raphanica]|nr:hypothetical protein FB446DRAFT_769229 [Lentinula raphanica]